MPAPATDPPELNLGRVAAFYRDCLPPTRSILCGVPADNPHLMSTQKVFHQGPLRGSYEIPMEQSNESDGETVDYKTALSGVGSDDSSDAGGSHRKTTHADPASQRNDPNDDLEVEELPDDYVGPQEHQKQKRDDTPRKTPEDSPAYVAPIGGNMKVPPIEPLSPSPHHTPSPEDTSETPRKPPVYQIPKDHLVGKKVDGFGDIVNDDGSVLGRVEGDLPSMVGRTISNARGDVLGDDGELLGYVAEVDTGKGQQKQPREQHPTWSLAEVMKAMDAQGKGPGGLRVDPFGNILDGEGNTVGSFHDNRTGFGRKNAPSRGDRNAGGGEPRSQASQSEEAPEGSKSDEQAESSSTQSQPQVNAQSHRKQPEERKDSPSDIFLDVKSTTEGIQLTIRIPTVFNNGGQPLQPKIVFS